MLSITMERGDTIIEVLLAITIFSMVSIGGMTIMNQGTNTSQRALEITLVRQQIDAQAEALRAAQQVATVDTDETVWEDRIASDTISEPYEGENCPATAPDGSFIMNPNTAEPVTSGSWFKDMNTAAATPFAQVRVSGGLESYGMWIERERIDGGDTPDVYNFVVNACWYGAGLDTPVRLDTLVRLYDPS